MFDDLKEKLNSILKKSDKNDNEAPIFYDEWDVHTTVCVVAPALPFNNNEWNVMMVYGGFVPIE